MHSDLLPFTSRSHWRKPQPASTEYLRWGSERAQKWGSPQSADTERPAASRESPRTGASQIFEPWNNRKKQREVCFNSLQDNVFSWNEKILWYCFHRVASLQKIKQTWPDLNRLVSNDKYKWQCKRLVVFPSSHQWTDLTFLWGLTSSWIVWLWLKPPAAGRSLAGFLVSLKVLCSLIWLQRPSPTHRNTHVIHVKYVQRDHDNTLSVKKQTSTPCDMVNTTIFAVATQ